MTSHCYGNHRQSPFSPSSCPILRQALSRQLPSLLSWLPGECEGNRRRPFRQEFPRQPGHCVKGGGCRLRVPGVAVVVGGAGVGVCQFPAVRREARHRRLGRIPRLMGVAVES
ncbi:hypothetical protein E2C01_097547 [Portunus trituberculatus]|uniref:Uncharacterized protein n=1 Tax=Portunus trituberculatus TaxID=210409 RepID=A0A5B7K0P6_PORTR|nr:hypothetical protein [Portunus trituberculatus]